ncbi:MAG: KilA-N domain-containing protein [Candidatus Saccharimonadales bacterium]
MTPKPNKKLLVANSEIKVINANGQDYICLTDMVKNYGDDQLIYSWLRNRNTVEFLGVWETLNNPNFNNDQFDAYRSQAGLNSFNLTPKKWIDTTGAIGIVSKAGRYGGGTFAQKDIAFEFGSYISAEFKLIIIKEFQRLKDLEFENEQWDYHRFLAKVNYRLQTDAIKQVLIPLTSSDVVNPGFLYASEADVVNIALFGKTAKQWRDENPEERKRGNIRDSATVEQLTVLANLESLNSMLISDGFDKKTRYEKLHREAQRQLSSLIASKIRIDPPIDSGSLSITE